jgi:hypothetical protein
MAGDGIRRESRPPVEEPTYDDRMWPIFIATMPRTPLSGDALTKHLDHIDGLFGRGQPFGLIFDVRVAPIPTAADRRRLAERMAKAAVRWPDQLRGVAVVTNSAVHRGVMTALRWLTRANYPPAVGVTTVDEGLDWLRKRLGLGKR